MDSAILSPVSPVDNSCPQRRVGTKLFNIDNDLRLIFGFVPAVPAKKCHTPKKKPAKTHLALVLVVAFVWLFMQPMAPSAMRPPWVVGSPRLHGMRVIRAALSDCCAGFPRGVK